MKKLLFILFLGFVFLNHVSAVDVNAQVDELLNNINKTKEKIQIITTYGRGLSDEYKRFLQRTDERVFV